MAGADTMVQQITDAITQNVKALVMVRAAEAFVAEHQPGGATFEKIKNDALSSASDVYSAYTPKVYSRRGTLTDEANIVVVVGDVQIKDNSVSITWKVHNTAIGVEGDMLEDVIMSGWRRPPYYFGNGPKGWWRIGGRDLFAHVDDVYTVDITLPADIVDECVNEAIGLVLGG